LWGRQEVFPLLCRDNPSQLLASSGRYRTTPRGRQFSPSQSSELASRRWLRASDRAATAAAMIITRWTGMRCPWSAPTQPTAVKSFPQSSKTITLVIKIGDEGKRLAHEHDHLAGSMALSAISNASSALRVALDMRAQFGDRAEPDRPVR